MAISYGPLVELDGLVTYLDATNPRSGFFPANQFWSDLSGLNNILSFPISSSWTATATLSWASTNGTNGYGVMARTVSTDFSILCWIRTASSAGTAGNWYQGVGIVDSTSTVTRPASDFGLTMGQGRLMFGTGGIDQTLMSSGTYNDSRWYHVAATRNSSNGTKRLYVNGTLLGTATGSTGALAAASNIRLGVLQPFTAGSYFAGDYGMVQIYNRVLSDIEVGLNFTAHRGRFQA